VLAHLVIAPSAPSGAADSQPAASSLPAARPRVLFICGSMNQTTQLHAVARALDGVDASFTPFYGNGLYRTLRRLGLVEVTIGGHKRRGWCLDYLRAHQLDIDLDGACGGYDLVVICTDLEIPDNVAGAKLVVVQEGIFDPEGFAYRVCRRFPSWPRWLAGTAMTGLSGAYDRMCVASDGYRDHLVARGADPATIAVTGIPNFDHCAGYYRNDFPHRNYVLVCTSDTRETLKLDSRTRFLARCKQIAGDRPVIFKLHPNENEARCTRDIRAVFPDALVYLKGSAEEMIANCDVLITQWSSTVFVGLALGKEVYSNFDVDELRRLCPVQNGGTSGQRIAEVCREVLAAPSR